MIVFYRLEGRDYKEIGRVKDGEIVAGETTLEGIIHRPDLSDEDELLNAHDGPHILAQMEDESDDGDSPPGSPNKDIGKWLPHNDGGGRGWIDATTGEKVFTHEPPGEVVNGFEKQANEWVEKGVIDKEWVPYEGPHGGEGWQEVESGRVRYQEEPPGQTSEEYENYWSENNDSETLSSPERERIDMDEVRNTVESVREQRSEEVGGDVIGYCFDNSIAVYQALQDEGYDPNVVAGTTERVADSLIAAGIDLEELDTVEELAGYRHYWVEANGHIIDMASDSWGEDMGEVVISESLPEGYHRFQDSYEVGENVAQSRLSDEESE